MVDWNKEVKLSSLVGRSAKEPKPEAPAVEAEVAAALAPLPVAETDERPRGSRLGTLMLTSLGGACIVFAFIAQSHRRAPAAARPRDALSDLVAESKRAAPELSGSDVTFPSLLSDDPRTTTALAALRASNTAAASASPPPRVGPPPPTDRLPVVPLPARNLVSGSSLVDHPRDSLTKLAKQAVVAELLSHTVNDILTLFLRWKNGRNSQ